VTQAVVPVKNPVTQRALSLLGQGLQSSAFWLLEHLLPARENFWCFCTWPGQYAHTMDNPRAVFEAVKDDPAIVKIILRKRGQVAASAANEGVNVIVVNVETLRGAYYLAVSRFILTGYGLGGLCSYSAWITSKHKIIQLWHGIPLKRIGKLFPGEKYWDLETPKYTATVCSSARDQAIMAAAFAPLPIENVWLCGLPRNDLFLKDEISLPADYRQQLGDLRRRLDGRRFVLYAPTWRATEDGIYAFSDEERAALDALSKRHNVAFGIRAHANRRIQDAYADSLKAGSIFFANDFPDVNVLLRITDVLVTDYSSIYIDFLLTGRPILHFTYDVEEYVKERGFLYELDEALPSKWFKSFGELLAQLDAALEGRGIDAQRYSGAKMLFHTHADHSGLQVANRIRALAAR
jgi:CDP-glycerol glycerophosphotransferase (TagB/SpsB family)